MNAFLIAAGLAIGLFVLKTREQRRRIILLGGHLGRFQIETLMERLIDGYLRALGERDAERQDQVWALLAASETQLVEQFSRFAASVAAEPEALTRVSRLPLALPFADRLLPGATFDLREMLQVHARGLAATVENQAGLSPRDKAFTLTAELLLLQHSCHWFCRSRMVASARVLARHQTPHAQLVASVSPQTRRDYLALTQGK
jgi:hypothetical protein